MRRLVGKVQPYAWGSKTAIPEFLGTQATDEPQAELWLGAHQSAPSRYGDEALDAAISASPATLVGAVGVAVFGPRLPYLVKVLAAGQPLSLQAHPSRQQAEEGFARDEAAGIALDAPDRTYRDDWPKPEALCALGEMQALCGFREPSQTYALFAELGVSAALSLVEPLRDGDSEAIASVFEQLLTMPESERAVISEVIAAAERAVEQQNAFGEFARTAIELNNFYPGDAGVLAGLLMNRVVFGKYEALFLPAGNLHAYLRGTGVEIMANSDNVLRGGLTRKHIDVAELLRLLDFTPGAPSLVEVVEESPGIWAYQTPAPEFSLWRLEIGEAPTTLPASGAGRVLLVTEGRVTLRGPGGDLLLTQGESAFVTAEESDVAASGLGTVFVGGPGVR